LNIIESGQANMKHIDKEKETTNVILSVSVENQQRTFALSLVV
jgi:hypothetical protein